MELLIGIFGLLAGHQLLSQLDDHQLQNFIQTDPTSGRFVCAVCRKSVASRPSALDHLKSVHAKRKDQVCQFCSDAFPNVAHLRKHISRKHPEDHRINQILQKSVLGTIPSLASLYVAFVIACSLLGLNTGPSKGATLQIFL